MLKVTHEQLDMLVHLPWEDEMLADLKEFAPRLFELRGEQTFRSLIRWGRQRAKVHGFSTRGPVRMFTQAMVSLGHRFDEDPQLAGIGSALRRDHGPEQEKARFVFAAIREYMDAALGESNEHGLAALTRLRDAHDLWESAPPGTEADFEADIVAHMRAIFPQKCASVPAPSLTALLREAITAAKTHGLDAMVGGRVIAALIFAFGWGITDDPLYPWVAKLLRPSENPGSTFDRATHLATRSRIYLAETLSYLGSP